MKKKSAIAIILVIVLCLAILMPFFAKSIFAGHHWKGENCQICEFIRQCDTLRDTLSPVTDQIVQFFRDLKIGQTITGLGFACPITLTSLHVRLDN